MKSLLIYFFFMKFLLQKEYAATGMGTQPKDSVKTNCTVCFRLIASRRNETKLILALKNDKIILICKEEVTNISILGIKIFVMQSG